MYVRRAECADVEAEVASGTADAGDEVVLQIEDAEAGPWFIAVDGRDGESGTFVLDIE